jgi:hypothetical protein
VGRFQDSHILARLGAQRRSLIQRRTPPALPRLNAAASSRVGLAPTFSAPVSSPRRGFFYARRGPLGSLPARVVRNRQIEAIECHGNKAVEADEIDQFGRTVDAELLDGLPISGERTTEHR